MLLRGAFAEFAMRMGERHIGFTAPRFDSVENLHKDIQAAEINAGFWTVRFI